MATTAALFKTGAWRRVIGSPTSFFAASKTRQFSTSTASQKKLFDKILIANRGEIACRVIRTCKRLGIKTVAVYSEPDKNSLHVRMADEAVAIGPAPSIESYLRADKILDAVKQTKAQAVHPGYGFLSENYHFVEDLQKAGVTFIGPDPKAMLSLGDKIESKKVAKTAGVSIVPGFIGEVHDVEEVLKIAHEIGYPVMIKASAGGGGKGMRIAWNDEEAKMGFRLSRQEAKAAFNDDRILIEKFIDDPRHIEIQILADAHGNVIYLPERECSIQRRNQKVIEEAPSPAMKPEVRKRMGEQAANLARAVGYKNTGTVEFLMDPTHNFYFLEMNTRLQVEHPITEEVTGIDIVEHMIRIAAGEKLSLTQDDVQIKGWAVESRVYAEDPLRNFLPSIGRLTRYQEPPSDASHNIRIDTGVEEGSQISIYYDPLIAKLVTHGKTREEAIMAQEYALDNYLVRGVNHNVVFLRDVMSNQRFLEGRLSTKFIPEEYPHGFKGHVLTAEEHHKLVAIAAAVQNLKKRRDISLEGRNGMSETLTEHYNVIVRGHHHDKAVPVTVTNTKGREVEIKFSESEKTVVNLDNWTMDKAVIPAVINGKITYFQTVNNSDLGFVFQYFGANYRVDVLNETEAKYAKYMPKEEKISLKDFLVSPMSGSLLSVAVTEGQVVSIGQELAIVEAMKMQNVLRAERDGVVKKIHAMPGNIALDQIILEFGPVPASAKPATK
jgi:propionyl-CoA carboxylase alpha chain